MNFLFGLYSNCKAMNNSILLLLKLEARSRDISTNDQRRLN